MCQSGEGQLGSTETAFTFLKGIYEPMCLWLARYERELDAEELDFDQNLFQTCHQFSEFYQHWLFVLLSRGVCRR